MAITRRLWTLSTPIIGINVLNVLMLAVDAALCGRLPDRDHTLAALGLSVQVVLLFMTAMLGLLVGTVALVSRAYGARDLARVNHLIAQSTILTAVVGVVVGAIAAAYARVILAGFGASAVVAEIGADYLRPLMLGAPFAYLTLLYTGVLRGVGNTRIPFSCAVIANIVNAVLNYGLVLGNLGMPALGVRGSAIGTVIAQLLNLVILVFALRRGAIANVQLSLPRVHVDRRLAIELFRVGWPAAVDSLIMNVAFLSAIAMLARIDELTVAAHGLGMRVRSLAFVPGLSIAQATGALVGQALGAGNVSQARVVMRAAMTLCLVIASGLALSIIVAARPLSHIFDVPSGTPLEALTVTWMRILGCTMVPAAIHISTYGLFHGAGATRTTLRINFWVTMSFQIPLAYVLGFALELGELGVWLSFPIAIAVKASVNFIAYKREHWVVTGVRLA
ncbi:MAG TPA: MATE family efflux transporter [Kofleriaceae bacterium]